MTRLGCTLDALGGGLTWPALFSFIRHLPPVNAITRETDPDICAWLAGERTASLIADLIDVTIAAHTPEGKTPKRVKRPTDTDNTQRFGADPIPISEFQAWWDSH